MSENGAAVDEMCDEVNTGNRHWVEDLFPPAFRLSLQQLVDGNIATAVLDRRGRDLPAEAETGGNDEELFVKLARGISPLDVTAIKNVYQRVWLMIQEASCSATNEKERTPDVEEDAQLQCSDEREVQLGSECHRAPTQGDPCVEQDSCVWDSSDIRVLRRAFRATSDENARLRSQVRVLQEDVEKLTAERCDQRKSAETSRRRLHDAQTANRRLQMLANHLKTELDRTTDQLSGLRSVEAERSDLSRRLQAVQTELSAADCRQTTNVARVEAKWMKMLEEQRLADAKDKSRLNGDIARLEGRVDELEQQLKREKEDHRRTMKGLEHLRVHFSTLPTNCVRNDELDNWTY